MPLPGPVCHWRPYLGHRAPGRASFTSVYVGKTEPPSCVVPAIKWSKFRLRYISFCKYTLFFKLPSPSLCLSFSLSLSCPLFYAWCSNVQATSIYSLHAATVEVLCEYNNPPSGCFLWGCAAAQAPKILTTLNSHKQNP